MKRDYKTKENTKAYEQVKARKYSSGWSSFGPEGNNFWKGKYKKQTKLCKYFFHKVGCLYNFLL